MTEAQKQLSRGWWPSSRSKLRQGLLAGMALFAGTIMAQELIYQEDFETDGEAASPKRYTTIGRDVYEVARIRGELGNQDQIGPIYFAHNNEVSYTGVPAPTGGRRMVMAWDLAITEADTSPAMLRLFDSAVKWLLNNKTGAKIVVTPAGANLGVLGERLVAAGHTLVDDDTTVPDEQITTLGDMLFHASGGSRGARAAFPMIVINSADADDVLTSSIGTPALFQPGKGSVSAASHPGAGGLTGDFDVAKAAFTWQLMGDTLPSNATILASFTQSVPPSVASLADVEAMVAGTKQSASTSGTIAALDFNDNSEGNWPGGDPVPGGATGVWGVRVTGKLNVTTAGTYTIASGADDGVRVRIDTNRNGLDVADTIISDPGPHGHTIIYGNVTFPATGAYDIEVLAYNSGGNGDMELSVSLTAGAGKTGLDADTSAWELLGTPGAASPVKAQGAFQVTAYTPAGGDVQRTLPLVMLLNGPNDTPPGSVFGGGPFVGQSGQRFFGGAGMNKWTVPETTDRSVTLRPVSVAGKTKVKLTIAVAGTFLDFERSGGTRGSADYLEVVVDTDGAGPKDFERLIFFTAPTGADKFVDDFTTRPKSPTRLGLTFKDVTYDIPAGATDLIVEVRALSTWWNEIFAFDNIRITAGDLPPAGTPGQPTELGQKVKGFQDDFTGAARDPNWVPRGPGGDLYKQGDGLLRVTVKASDPNHLLYEAAGYNNTVQEVLARIRVTAFGTGDPSRAGLGVGVQTTPASELSRGINLHFRDNNQDGVTGKQFKLLDDARAWGPAGLKEDWAINSWYWMRLRQDPNANGGTDDVFGKVWKADGKTDEPSDWQLKWNYIPARTARTGFAGITGSSIEGLGSFEVDYILIKADGLPEITPKWDPTGPAATTAKFTGLRAVSATQIELEWVGAGVLESADSPAGPWTAVAGASSPRRITTSGAAKFYRLKQ